MQKKRNTKSVLKPVDIFIIFICLVGLAYTSFLLYKDLNTVFTKDEKPIGVIYFKHNSAQRRMKDKNVWESLRTSMPIYNGDRIRTAEDSEAYTVFNNQVKIDLHENTLVQVFSDEGKNSLDFINGSVSVSSSEEVNSLEVKTGDSVLTFDKKTDAVIMKQSNKTTKASVAVTSGKINVSSKTQINETDTPKIETISVEKGNSLVYSTTQTNQNKEEKNTKSIEHQVTKVEPELIMTPSPSLSVFTTPDEVPTIPFYWNSSKPIILEFSMDPMFSVIVASKKLKEGNKNSSIPLDFTNGMEKIYWRAVEEDKSGKNIYQKGKIFLENKTDSNVTKIMADTFGKEKAVEMEQFVTRLEVPSQTFTDNEIVKNISPDDYKMNEEIEKVKVLAQKASAFNSPELVKETENAVVVLEKEYKVTPKAIEKISEIKEFNEIKSSPLKKNDLEPKQISSNKEQTSLQKKPVPPVTKKQKQPAKKITSPKKIAPVKKEIVKEPVKKANTPSQDKIPKEIQETKIVETTKNQAKEQKEQKEVRIETEVNKKVEQENESVESKPKIEDKKDNKLVEQKNVEKEDQVKKQDSKKEPSVKPIILTVPVLVEPVSAKIFTENDFVNKAPEIIFKWNKVKDASWYVFTLYQGGITDEKLVTYKVKKNSFALKDNILSKIDNGELTWTVYAVAESDGKKIKSTLAKDTFSVRIGEIDKVEIDANNLLDAK